MCCICLKDKIISEVCSSSENMHLGQGDPSKQLFVLLVWIDFNSPPFSGQLLPFVLDTRAPDLLMILGLPMVAWLCLPLDIAQLSIRLAPFCIHRNVRVSLVKLTTCH